MRARWQPPQKPILHASSPPALRGRPSTSAQRSHRIPTWQWYPLQPFRHTIWSTASTNGNESPLYAGRAPPLRLLGQRVAIPLLFISEAAPDSLLAAIFNLARRRRPA